MKLKKFLKKIINYFKFGNKTYIQINQINDYKILNGKNIVVTGGTSGIGLEIAKKVISCGGNVIITGRNKEKLNILSKELKCKAIEWDISNLDEINKKVNEIYKMVNGKLDCFINCAGIYKDIKYNDCNFKDFEEIMNTNLNGPYFAISEIIKKFFDKNKKGNIIIIGSNRGIIGDDGPYGISKAGIINYGQGLAKKLLNNNVRVNIINPGMTASNINKIKDTDNLYTEGLKGKRVIAAKEIANIVIFLISDSSTCITGQVINCDNGETIL